MKSVLFLGKKNDVFTSRALAFCKKNFKNIEFYLGDRDSSFNDKVFSWKGDYIVSYLFPKKIPNSILKNSRLLALNFHPSTPDYPGIGCTNYAIYNKESEFGATCHIINQKIDSGPIISVEKFKVSKNETLISLTNKTYSIMYKMFIKIITKILDNRTIKQSNKIKWKGKPKTRKDFANFLKMDLNMSKKEMINRIKATTYPNYQSAYLEVNGLKFFAKIHE